MCLLPAGVPGLLESSWVLEGCCFDAVPTSVGVAAIADLINRVWSLASQMGQARPRVPITPTCLNSDACSQ